MAQTCTTSEIKERLKELTWDQLDQIYQATYGHNPHHISHEGLVYYLSMKVDSDMLIIPDNILEDGF